MRIKSSTILRSAVPLALGLMSMNATAAGPMSSYVPLKAPCQVIDTGADSFDYVKDASQEARYRVWAGKDKDGTLNNLSGQGGLAKCVNPMPGMHPTAVVISVSPRANNGARGNLAVYGDHIKSADVFGKESTINFWNTNSTNTTIVRMGPDSDYIKIRAKLFATTEAGKKLKLKVTGNVLGFFYENKKDDKHHLWHVIHVGKDGTGDFEDPITAVNSIKFSDINNQWLVKIGPGNFDLGKFQLQMKEYVRIEGSGRHVTKLFGNHGSDNDNDAKSALVIGADWGTLANMTVKNKGTNDNWDARIGVYNKDVSPTFDNVRIFTHGTGNRVCGISNYTTDDPKLLPSRRPVTEPRIFDSEIEGVNRRGAYGAGFCNHGTSEPDIVDTTVLGSGIVEGYGIFNAEFARPRLNDVYAKGSGVVLSPKFPDARVGKGIGMYSIHGARPVAAGSVFEGDVAFAIADGELTTKVSKPGKTFPLGATAADLMLSARLTRITNSTVININRTEIPPHRARIVDPYRTSLAVHLPPFLAEGLPLNIIPPYIPLAPALVSGPLPPYPAVDFQCHDVSDIVYSATHHAPAVFHTKVAAIDNLADTGVVATIAGQVIPDAATFAQGAGALAVPAVPHLNAVPFIGFDHPC